MKKVLTLVFILCTMFILVGCKEQYNVTFISNGGTEISSVNVKEGGTIQKPVDPVKEGHTFIGWYSDPTYSSEYDFNKPISGMVILFSKWEINLYNVVFMFDENNVLAEEEYFYGTILSDELDSIHNLENHIILGWYTDTNLSNKYDLDQPLKEDVTLYPEKITKNMWLYEYVRENSNQAAPKINTDFSNRTIYSYTMEYISSSNRKLFIEIISYDSTFKEPVIRFVHSAFPSTNGYFIGITSELGSFYNSAIYMEAYFVTMGGYFNYSAVSTDLYLNKKSSMTIKEAEFFKDLSYHHLYDDKTELIEFLEELEFDIIDFFTNQIGFEFE